MLYQFSTNFREYFFSFRFNPFFEISTPSGRASNFPRCLSTCSLSYFSGLSVIGPRIFFRGFRFGSHLPNLGRCPRSRWWSAFARVVFTASWGSSLWSSFLLAIRKPGRCTVFVLCLPKGFSQSEFLNGWPSGGKLVAGSTRVWELRRDYSPPCEWMYGMLLLLHLVYIDVLRVMSPCSCSRHGRAAPPGGRHSFLCSDCIKNLV